MASAALVGVAKEWRGVYRPPPPANVRLQQGFKSEALPAVLSIRFLVYNGVGVIKSHDKEWNILGGGKDNIMGVALVTSKNHLGIFSTGGL